MRNILFLIFVTALQAYADDIYSQNTKLTLNLNDVTVANVLEEIQNKSEFNFLFNAKLIDVKRKVSVSMEDKKISEILTSLFSGIGVNYLVYDRQIVLTPSDVTSLSVAMQQLQITGTVTGMDGTPLPGANVVVTGTTQGTMTDIAGKYSIELPPGSKSLTFSFIGMEPQEITIGTLSQINVTMAELAIGLEEVVVIGYGTQKKKDMTGSVASVKVEQLENVPASRVDQILQGRAVGVQVTQISGEPGIGSTIRIRGGNSIQGDNEPLYVIDGFIVGTDFDLNNINVNDIESINVLKDAVSIAIYGTRGANGVILITTKSGQKLAPGKPIISVNAYSGIQELQKTVDFANGPELAYIQNLHAKTKGQPILWTDMDKVPDVDWIDQITKTAPMTNLDVVIKGQSENKNMNYYVSSNYLNQDGIVRNSGIEKYIFRTNLDIRLSEKFTMGVRMNISHQKKENNKVRFSDGWDKSPANRAVYNEDGTFTSTTHPYTAVLNRNSEADIQLRVDHQYGTNIIGNAYLQYEPIKGLVLKSSIGPQINNFKYNFYLPGIMPEILPTLAGGSTEINSNLSIDILNENTITFARQINKNHKFDALAGFTIQTYDRESYSAKARGFTNDVLQFNDIGLGDPLQNVVSSGYYSFQLVSWLGRLNYSYKEKYLLTLVGRVDGSSRFAGSNNEYAFFPSAALAWRLNEEPWIKNLNVFHNLKLRISSGIAGSQAIDSYRTLAILTSHNIGMLFNNIKQLAISNGRPYSPNLKWETTHQSDVGLESAYFGGRLAVEIDYYYKKTKDLLLNVEIPGQTGFSSTLQNLGSLQNQGIELLINTVNIKKKDFSWETTLSLASNRSKVLNIGNSEYLNIVTPARTQGGPGGRLYVGHPVPVFVGLEYLGIWKSQEEIDASGIQNQKLGGPRFKDTDGDGILSFSDFDIIGSPEADFYGGLMNSFTYRNFRLDIYFNGSYGNDLFNSVTQQAFFYNQHRFSRH